MPPFNLFIWIIVIPVVGCLCHKLLTTKRRDTLYFFKVFLLVFVFIVVKGFNYFCISRQLPVWNDSSKRSSENQCAVDNDLTEYLLSVVKPRTKSPFNLPKMRKHRKRFPEIVAVGNIVLCLFEFICHPHFLLLAKIIVSSFCLLISKVNNRLSFPSNSF